MSKESKIEEMIQFIVAGNTYKKASEQFGVPFGSIASHMRRSGYHKDEMGKWIQPESSTPITKAPVKVYTLTPEEIEARYGKPGELAEKKPFLPEQFHQDPQEREDVQMRKTEEMLVERGYHIKEQKTVRKASDTAFYDSGTSAVIKQLEKEDKAEADYIDPDWGFVPDPFIDDDDDEDCLEPIDTTFCDQVRQHHFKDMQRHMDILNGVSDAIINGRMLPIKDLFTYERLRRKYCR